MEITLFGAAKEVTGSCYSLVTKNGEKILIDCGMFQGSQYIEDKNYEDLEFDPSEYHAVILTHAHLDHCGRIPKLVRAGFKGPIYSTDATKDLAFIIMMDSAKIAKNDLPGENRRRSDAHRSPRKLIYSEGDVNNAINLFKTVKYGEDIKITENITAKFYDAGHILGAASIKLTVREENKAKTLAFSSDIGQKNSLIVKNTEPITDADYVFIESTYGDGIHPPRAEGEKQFLKIIKANQVRGGRLMIPSFAIERTQSLLYIISQFQQKDLIPPVNVFLDSPMAIRVTEVFLKYPEYYNEELRNSLKKRKDPFNFPGLVNTPTMRDSKKINNFSGPHIVIAGNGMCSGGRIEYYIKNYIDDKNNTLMFTGFQAEGTLGRAIKSGEKKVRVLGSEVEVKAKIEVPEGFSAHADRLGLMAWLKNFSPKPKKVFIVHGEEIQMKAFEKRVNAEGMKTRIPSFGEKIEL